MGKAAPKSGKVSNDFVMVLITTPSPESAEKISRGLLDEKLIACASTIQGMCSLFWWEGQIDKANELLIICKTRQSLVKRLTEFVCKRHEYKVPEIIAVPIVGGNPDYLEWVKESTVE
jgi:periplasmic divalent cation tolerance protein